MHAGQSHSVCAEDCQRKSERVASHTSCVRICILRELVCIVCIHIHIVCMKVNLACARIGVLRVLVCILYICIHIAYMDSVHDSAWINRV